MSTWDEIIKPLFNSGRWAELRQAAISNINRSQDAMGEVFGISSSDVNHTIYGAASFLVRNGTSADVDSVLDILRAS